MRWTEQDIRFDAMPYGEKRAYWQRRHTYASELESTVYGPRGWRRGQPHLCVGCFTWFARKSELRAHQKHELVVHNFPCFVELDDA